MSAKNKSDIEQTAEYMNSNLFRIAENIEYMGGFDDSSFQYNGITIAESLYQIAKALTKISEAK